MPGTLEQLRWRKFPVLDDGFVCLVDVMGDDHAVVAGGTGQLCGGHAACVRRPHADPLPDAAPAHHAVRDGRGETAGPRADGLLAAVDPAPHGVDQRDQHALLDRHRRRASHPARPVAAAGQPTTARGARVFWIPRRARSFRPARPSCSSTRGRCTSSGWSWASPASRPAKTCRFRPTPRRIGRSTCTICCISCNCGWTAARSGRFANMPRPSAARSCARCFRWSGRRLSTTGWKRCI